MKSRYVKNPVGPEQMFRIAENIVLTSKLSDYEKNLVMMALAIGSKSLDGLVVDAYSKLEILGLGES